LATAVPPGVCSVMMLVAAFAVDGDVLELPQPATASNAIKNAMR